MWTYLLPVLLKPGFVSDSEPKNDENHLGGIERKEPSLYYIKNQIYWEHFNFEVLLFSPYGKYGLGKEMIVAKNFTEGSS